MGPGIAAQIEAIFREEHGRILAALISQLGDFPLAEGALQDALVNALERRQQAFLFQCSFEPDIYSIEIASCSNLIPRFIK